MIRDLDEFKKFGYNKEKSSMLVEEVKKFEAIPLDVELKGNQGIATELKNKKAMEIKDFVGKINVRIKTTFGSKSALYRKFSANDISRLSDDSLLVTARYIAKTCSMYLDQLKEKGLTEEIITDLNQLADDFESSIYNQYNAIADREIGTYSRADQANLIYTETSKISEIGKEIWQGVNEAKYNDYLIYDTPTGRPDDEEENTEELSQQEQEEETGY